LKPTSHQFVFLQAPGTLWFNKPLQNVEAEKTTTSEVVKLSQQIPTPIEGEGGGGTKPTCGIPLFFAWKPWDSDPIAQMEF